MQNLVRTFQEMITLLWKDFLSIFAGTSGQQRKFFFFLVFKKINGILTTSCNIQKVQKNVTLDIF